MDYVENILKIAKENIILINNYVNYSVKIQAI